MTNYASISIDDLLRRCSVAGDVGAWEEFVRRFHRLIASVVLRTAKRLGDGSPQTADDLIQEVYLKLCADTFKILRTFDQRHPDAFLGYLRVVVANVVRDHFKSVHAQKRGHSQIEELNESAMATDSAEEASGAPAVERRVLMEEIGGHLMRCLHGPDRERDWNVFWLHYRAGLSAQAIASLPGVELTPKGVESLLLRMTRRLRDRLTSPDKPGTKFDPDFKSDGIFSASSFIGGRNGFGTASE